MRLESRRILTAKKVGCAIFFLILVVYIATSNFLTKVSTISYNISDQIQELISEKTTRGTMLFNMTTLFKPTTMTAGRNGTRSTTKINHQDTLMMKKTIKATTTTNTPNLTTIKIFTITPSKSSLGDYRILKTSNVHPKTTVPPKHFICFNPTGRLGNLMFQYAAAYGIARSKGMGVIISKNNRITKIFHINRGGRVLMDTSMCQGVEKIGEARSSAFDKQMVNFRNNKNIALVGYLQSFKYFEKVSDEIRRQFTFRDSIKNQAENVIRDILHKHLEKHSNETQNWTFVAVHVRRGDMVNNPHGYMVAPQEYFNLTQNIFRNFYKHVLFVVCSDDIEWCKANLQPENTYFVTGNSAEVDMAVISSCNHTISSVGSFSWWSAWLSHGIVTYYCPPAKPGTALRTQYSKDYRDYFPSKWIRIKL